MEDWLQDAAAALRHSIEVLRRRPVDDVAVKLLVPELHELRTVMSTVARLMQAFGQSRLDQVDAEPVAAEDHFTHAADHLTSARKKLAAASSVQDGDMQRREWMSDRSSSSSWWPRS